MKDDIASDTLRREALSSCFDVVRLLRSIEECKQPKNGEMLLEEFLKNMVEHRKSLARVEKFAKETIANRFRNSSGTGFPMALPSGLVVKQIKDGVVLPESAMILKSPLPPVPPPSDPSKTGPLPLPSLSPLHRGEKFYATVQLAASPLEFFVIRSEELVFRRRLEARLQEQPRKAVTLLGVGDICAVLFRERLMRAEVREMGVEDVLVSLVDRGNCNFVPRSHIFELSDEFRQDPPFARFCSLAHADIRKTDAAAMNNFMTAVTQKPEVIILACGKQRKTHGELVTIVEEKPSLDEEYGGQGDGPSIRKKKRNARKRNRAAKKQRKMKALLN